MNVAEVRQAGKRFGDRWALRHIDLSLPEGAVLGLVGPNGAGKTTLLHLLVGLASPSEGDVTVFGQPPGSAIVLPDIAFVAQDAPLPRRLRITELMRACAAMNPRWDRSVVDERIDALQLDRRSRVGTLSGGQRAQLGLALALAKQPRLLVLDEPVASLDPLARRAFLGALMGAVAANDLTVVYSTHLLEDLERACDHLAVIAGGEMRLMSPIDDVVRDHVVLSGPSGRNLPPGVAVISSTVSGQHAEHLVVLGGPVHDPTWIVRPATLEEVVFAHLADERGPAHARMELVS
ncbi:MAG: transport system ATP-binding protein [Ilumatobacteraceae bacterium]|nr:transport system ATP-binding protein [Ilumatobacteraceae bacterium]